MNQDIKKYWEDLHGAKAVCDNGSTFWHIPIKSGGIIIIAMKVSTLRLLDSLKRLDNFDHLDGEDWIYPLNGAPRDEKTIFKMLKLKAFL